MHACSRAIAVTILSLATFSWSPAAVAQTISTGDSSIRVKVIDPSGAVLVGARVVILDDTGASAETLTNDSGQAVFWRILPGRYAIRAEYEGFQPVEQRDVRVRGRETRRELRLPLADRSRIEDLDSLRIASSTGRLVPLAELGAWEKTTRERSIYHKNLMPVVYVTADVAGREESPVYPILQLDKELTSKTLPEGYKLETYTAQQPADSDRLAMKWDGEWHITYEVFRDLGIAFAAVLILIYVLVVGWFQSFITPLVIMAAIPFSLVGILPAHAAMGAFFTATSMIGFIAGAGIVVRNSIILVDFIELRRRQGMPIAEAVVDAGAVRFRPMALTAAAVIAGSAVILFDPIFQGLAISLMAGEVASLLLSRMTVPITYYMTHRRQTAAAATPLAAA